MSAVATPPSLPFTSRSPRESSDELVVVGLADRQFVVPLAAVVAVLDPAAIDLDVSAAGTWIGAFRTGGHRIPVADARLIFDLPMDAEVGRILVLQGRAPFALAVDDLLGTLRPAPDDVRLLSPLCGNPASLLIDASVWDGDRLLIRLDHLAIERWLSEPVGDGELRQWQPLALPLPASDQAQGALLVDVDGDRFALPASWVRHIAEDRVPVPLARVHQTIAGLLSWERTPLPVIDVVRGSGRVSTARMLLVVVGHPPGPSTPPSHPVAVLRVSGVSDVVAVAEWSRESAKLADGRRIPLLDIDRALAVD